MVVVWGVGVVGLVGMLFGFVVGCLYVEIDGGDKVVEFVVVVECYGFLVVVGFVEVLE